MTNLPVLGILLGDATGVGPELVAKLAENNFYQEYCRPVIIGDLRVLRQAQASIGGKTAFVAIDDVHAADWTRGIPVLDQKDQDPAKYEIGKADPYCGKAVNDMLKTAIALYQQGLIQGFCFAPFNKLAMIQGGCEFESEHHLMADLFHHTEPFGEINVLGDLWTTRTTSHIPIKGVSDALTVESILRAIRLANATLKNAGIEKPILGIAALNPHGGEGGHCGREEIDVIQPAMEQARAMGIVVDGPYPADILFIKAFRGDFNGVVTMYHDQGQIALKLRGFDQGITIAGGLPAPIVTCAHGTAYDIAGKGIASTSAFENAIKMCSQMAVHMANTQQGGQGA